jgi:predicted kinase
VPRLILLNGPPGCGKSTLAQMYVDDHPLALSLDIDRVRSLIGRWQDRPEESGLLAREMALAMARAHLLAGHDVVIPQYLGRLRFIEQLEQLAGEVAADFHELVLMDSKDNLLRRFVERGRSSTLPAHVEAQEMVDRDGGLPAFAAMCERLLLVLAARPGATTVQTHGGQVPKAYRDLLRHLE